MATAARSAARSCLAPRRLLRAAITLPPRRPLCAAAGEQAGLGGVSGADDISVLKLYRDCMRLTYHIAADSAKGQAMREMVRAQFRSNAHVTDAEEIRKLKMLGVVGLQNYVIHEQTGRAIAKRGGGSGGGGGGGGGGEKSK